MKTSFCKKCNTAVIWLKHKETLKPTMIELEPHAKGNVLIHDGFYRFVTPTEKQKCRDNRKPLFRAHFSFCPEADHFRNQGKIEIQPPYDASKYEQTILPSLVITERDKEMVKVWKTYDKAMNCKWPNLTSKDTFETFFKEK